jgi:hypothetical protein
LDMGYERAEARGAKPREFGGVSGSGLWRVSIGRYDDGTFTWDEKPVLEGVAFYQNERDDQTGGAIRCHGRRSIYDNL